ncbi:TPA: hypothetical protein N0F65_009639 [Lagenidium giganteum]|uniref:PUB domain-containing protein n=1 Tax=Lagenidium giganteum TaxID=4803 RepID=A0AAV2YK95_9STRA|nr:TPA: hypothetical protein N0F65_009639 [Lagenidium giganteum]
MIVRRSFRVERPIWRSTLGRTSPTWHVGVELLHCVIAMDWLKKKKEEVAQAAAKIQNKRTAFKGEGNVLGGAEGDAHAAAAPASNEKPSGFKIPTFSKATPPPLSEEEQRRRREQQAKALEARTGAWDKRVSAARNARLKKEEEIDARFDLPPPPSSATTTDAAVSDRQGPVGPVLSAEEFKAREIQLAQSQVGFNPYAATFSSSSEASTIMNSIGGAAAPPPAPAAAAAPGAGAAPFLNPGAAITQPQEASNAAVYVLLRQEPAKAITACETMLKMLSNILTQPCEDKFRKIRLSNASIQTKLVAVPGAVELLKEAGFVQTAVDGDEFLILSGELLDVDRVQSVHDRTEVALIQLQHDS